MIAGLVCCGLAVVAVIASLVIPVDSQEELAAQHSRQEVPQIQLSGVPGAGADYDGLMVKVAGSRLIRPAQVQAAVKDTGAAQRLLERLKLQSVVSMGGQPVAYLRVNKEGVQSVRAGGRVLDFIVESVKPGEVKLSLDGVVVTLGH